MTVENLGFGGKVPCFPERVYNLPWTYDSHHHGRVSSSVL
jgi:hypothetical protein